ncbi:glutathione S-transferase N-terminal domain-containing protein [Paraburkholderia sp. SIMBA_053]|uniref:glutathione S-transferase N-terminal domain-containing protein n=1 Tax=Paraburkholderia sp. SIMBA_053 TaxID=3085794 RepID=UPI00397B6CDC
MTGHATFILRSSLTSPFVRKIRMVVEVLGLTDRVTLQPAAPYDEDDSLRTQNPLGKYPCLVCNDGNSFFDSSVILEYLQEVAQTDRLLPAQGPQRIRMLVQTRLADGIIDAGALVIYEHRYHEKEHMSEKWLHYQRGKIWRALSSFEACPPSSQETNAVSIGLACALGFLDKRQIVDWRASCPRLCGWLADFAANEPAFERTSPFLA